MTPEPEFDPKRYGQELADKQQAPLTDEQIEQLSAEIREQLGVGDLSDWCLVGDAFDERMEERFPLK